MTNFLRHGGYDFNFDFNEFWNMRPNHDQYMELFGK